MWTKLFHIKEYHLWIVLKTVLLSNFNVFWRINNPHLSIFHTKNTFLQYLFCEEKLPYVHILLKLKVTNWLLSFLSNLEETWLLLNNNITFNCIKIYILYQYIFFEFYYLQRNSYIDWKQQQKKQKKSLFCKWLILNGLSWLKYLYYPPFCVIIIYFHLSTSVWKATRMLFCNIHFLLQFNLHIIAMF